MGKALIVYFSLSGNTEKMAQYIAEGIRFAGQQVDVRKTSAIKNKEQLEGYDGYIFGSPTYYRDVAEPMKTFLFLARQVNLEGKLAGAFGSYAHDGNAPAIVMETMEYVFKMEPFELGTLNMLEVMLQEPGRDEPGGSKYVAGEVHGQPGEGMRACQDYGRTFGEKIAS